MAKTNDDPILSMYVGHHHTHILHPRESHPHSIHSNLGYNSESNASRNVYSRNTLSTVHSGMPLHLSFSLFQCRFHINAFFVPCTTDERLRKLNAPLAIVYKSQLHWAWIPTVSYAHHNCIFQTDNWKHNASYIISDLQWAVRSMDIAWLQLIWGSLMFAQKEQMDVKIAGAYCNCMSGE